MRMAISGYRTYHGQEDERGERGRAGEGRLRHLGSEHSWTGRREAVEALAASGTVRTVCAHDCPDACSVLVTVQAGQVVRTVGDPAHPFTQGFLCGKVNRYAERVHSPERVLTPLRRVGPKGAGQFTPTTWDAALDEIVSRWQAIIAQYGSEALAGYAYSAHQGLVNRNFTQAL